MELFTSAISNMDSADCNGLRGLSVGDQLASKKNNPVAAAAQTANFKMKFLCFSKSIIVSSRLCLPAAYPACRQVGGVGGLEQ